MRSVWKSWPLAILGLVAACNESPQVNPMSPNFSVTGPPWDVFEICKTGTNATFDVTMTNNNTGGGGTTTSTVSLNAGECKSLTGGAVGVPGAFTITVAEQSQPGVIQLDSIVVD